MIPLALTVTGRTRYQSDGAGVLTCSSIDEPPAPELSVIISAYNRDQFVEDAIASVLNQQFDLKKVELIVISNLPRIDDQVGLITRKQARVPGFLRVIRTESISLGESLALAISSARGPVLFFLNDDDLWTSSKLEMVYGVFNSNPRVGFAHNGQTLIGPEGEPAARSFAYAVLKHPSVLRRLRRRVASPEELLKHPKLISRYEADFNSSSIAIRKAVADQWIDELRRMKHLDDIALMSFALASGRSLALLPDRLTLYRLHRQNMSFHGSKTRKSRLSEAEALSDRHIRSLTVLQDAMTRRGRPDISELFDRHQRYFAAVLAVQSNKSSTRERAAAARGLLEAWIDQPDWKLVPPLIGCSLSLVAPDLVHSLYSAT